MPFRRLHLAQDGSSGGGGEDDDDDVTPCSLNYY